MRRKHGFCDLILAPGEQLGRCLTLIICRKGGDYCSISFSIVGGQAADTGNLEYSARQRLFCQAVCFYDLYPELDGHIFRGQLGRFIGLYHAIHRHERARVPFRVVLFFYRVLALWQRIGNSDSLLVGRHAADLHAALDNIEHHAGDRLSVQLIRLGDLDFALGRLVLHVHGIGFLMLGNLHFGGEVRIHIMLRNGGFLDPVPAIVQPAAFRHAVLIRCEGKRLANIRAIRGRRNAEASDCKYHSSQGFLGQRVFFGDLDFALDWRILRRQFRGLFGNNFCR